MAAGWRSGSGRGGRSNNCFVSSHNARLRASQGLTRRGLVLQSKLEQERYALLCRVPISEPYQICSCWSPTSSGANFTLFPPKSNFAFAHAAIRRTHQPVSALMVEEEGGTWGTWQQTVGESEQRGENRHMPNGQQTGLRSAFAPRYLKHELCHNCLRSA